MSTYNRPDKFVPVNISSDPTAFLQYTQKRMDLMSTGEAMVRSQYNQILGLDLTHAENKQKINTFLQEAQGEAGKSLNKDLSNLDNVNSALKIFDPLTKNPEYAPAMLDAQYTKHYNNQMQVAESYRHMQDKKGNVGMQYSDYNMAELQQNYQRFKGGQGNNPTSWGDMYSYTPYYNGEQEVLEVTKEFLKHPDSFEQETVDQNGMTQKVKYEGKSAEQLQLYLSNVLSQKAKDQWKLEGRVTARQISNKNYIKMLQGTTKSNLTQVNDQLADLEVFKKDPKKSPLSPKEIEIRRGQLESRQIALEKQAKDLEDPTQITLYENNKVDDYPNTYLAEKLGRLSQSLAIKKTSQTLGSNSAIVSLRNREQGANELIMRLNQEREFHNDRMANERADLQLKAQKNAIDAAKEGLEPDGTPKANTSGSGAASGGVSTVVAPSELTDGDAIQVSVDNYEKDLQNKINGAIVGIASDAYSALGFTEKSYVNDKKALTFAYSVAREYADGKMANIMKTPNSQLSTVDKAKKAIALKFEKEDAHVIEGMAYHDNKMGMQKVAKSNIIQDLQKAGVTVQQINEAMNTTDYTDAIRQGAYKQEGVLSRSYQPRQHNFKSLDEVAQRLVTDKDFAAGFDDRMDPTGRNILNTADWVGEFAAGFSIPGLVKNISKIGEEKVSRATPAPTNATAHYDKLQKDIALKAVLIGNQQTLSRPLSIENTLDKAKNSEFESRINQLKALHPEDFKDINPDSIVSIIQKDGGYQLNRKELVGKEGAEKRGSEDDDPIIIADPTVKAISDVDASKFRALSWSKNGSYSKTEKYAEAEFKYNVRTSTGTPYTGNAPLGVEIMIGDSPIQVPETFENPTSAETYVKRVTKDIYNVVFDHVHAKVRQAVIVDLQKQNISQEEMTAKLNETMKALQTSGKFSEMIKARTEEIKQTGEIYKAFGFQNPNTTPTDQKLNDLYGN